MPAKHGAENDPRHRAARVRKPLSFSIDLVVHLGYGASAGYALHQLPQLAQYSGLAVPTALGVFVLLPLADRIFVQWAFRATLAKLLTGLRVIRDDTGNRPPFWFLTKEWLSSVVAVLALLSN